MLREEARSKGEQRIHTLLDLETRSVIMYVKSDKSLSLPSKRHLTSWVR